MAYKILQDFTAFQREYKAGRDEVLTPLDIEGWNVPAEAVDQKITELRMRNWIRPLTPDEIDAELTRISAENADLLKPLSIVEAVEHAAVEAASPEEQLPGT